MTDSGDGKHVTDHMFGTFVCIAVCGVVRIFCDLRLAGPRLHYELH